MSVENIKKVTSVIMTSMIVVSGITISSILKRNDDNPYNGNTIVNTTNQEIMYTSYNDLLIELNRIMQEKNFAYDAKKLLIEYFEQLYENYDSFYEIYKINNCPDKETFINVYFLQNLRDNVDYIKNVDIIGNDVNCSGAYSLSTKTIEKKLTTTATELGHEVDHGNQGNLKLLISQSPELYNIFAEGSVTWGEQRSKKEFCVSDPIVFKNDSGECYAVRGVSKDDYKYPIYSKCYAMLASIVDHKVLKDVFKFGSLDGVHEYISNNYSIDSKQLINDMINLCETTSFEDNELYLTVERLEQTLNKCFYEKLNSLSSSDELISFINMKRYYDMQYSTKKLVNYVDECEFDIQNNSNLDLYKVNDLLYQKVREFNALPIFSNNNEKDRKMFGSIMGESSDHFSYYSVGEAININKLEYVVSTDENAFTLLSDSVPIVQYNYNDNRAYRNIYEINEEYIDCDAQYLIFDSKNKLV